MQGTLQLHFQLPGKNDTPHTLLAPSTTRRSRLLVIDTVQVFLVQELLIGPLAQHLPLNILVCSESFWATPPKARRRALMSHRLEVVLRSITRALPVDLLPLSMEDEKAKRK